MAEHLPDLPPLVPAQYRWGKSETEPHCSQRRGCGSENLLGIQKANVRGQYDFHLLITLRALDSLGSLGVSLAALKNGLVDALLKSRFQHPEIACDVTWDGSFGPLIQYRPPMHQQDALTWAQETVHVRATSDTAMDIRKEIVEQHLTKGSDSWDKPSRSVTVYIIANVASEHVSLATDTTVEVLFHMNHIYWDGVSARSFVGDILRDMGPNLGLEHPSQYDWGQEVSNLSIPVLDSLKVDLASLSDQYKTSVNEFLSTLFRYGVSVLFDL